jgi:hypothetical protein
VIAQYGGAAGAWAGDLPCFLAAQDPRLVTVLPEEIEVTRQFWMYCREDLRKLKRITLLWDYIREVTEANAPLLMGRPGRCVRQLVTGDKEESPSGPKVAPCAHEIDFQVAGVSATRPWPVGIERRNSAQSYRARFLHARDVASHGGGARTPSVPWPLSSRSANRMLLPPKLAQRERWRFHNEGTHA